MAVLTIVFMWKYIFHWNEENVLCSNYTAKSYSLILVESVSEQIRMYQILCCAEQRIQIEYLLINREYAMIQIVGHSLFRWWLPGGLQSLGKYLSLSQNWIDQHQSCKNSHIGTEKSKSQTAKQRPALARAARLTSSFQVQSIDFFQLWCSGPAWKILICWTSHHCQPFA